ncbi:sulfite exporter TauE/SafE family protein [Brachybacterium sp. Marseille-Q7125]|uniref:sulfite exporter TauE/SafE family protein n=1 Tax=Brachybacterium sp. Marseille-Q7125 TaxID=2932815 RepID=UPI001FF65332|nr:sulfite exporter TauE/SafE family protein [Brachybacterium sp. Marseille-Q7125]
MTDAGTLAMLGLAAATFAGAVAQRSTGMGFALLASPFLTLVLGPFEGILVANVCGSVASLLNLTQVWRDVDWSRAAILVPMGLVGVVPGAIAVLLLPTAPLMIGVSAVVIIGLGLTMMLRGRTLPSSRTLAAAGGLASGFMNVTAGVGGPGVVVYARATGWPHHRFAATAQLQFLTLGIASLLSKQSLPALTAVGWSALLASLILGLLVGNWISPKIEPELAMRLVMAVAIGGAVLAFGRGLASLL